MIGANSETGLIYGPENPAPNGLHMTGFIEQKSRVIMSKGFGVLGLVYCSTRYEQKLLFQILRSAFASFSLLA